MLAKIENGVVTEWPLGEHFIQAAYPDTSFGFPLTDETLKQFGFARFEYADPPAHDPEFQEARELTPTLSGVIATQSWEIVEKFTPEEKAAYIAKRDADREESQKRFVREERNNRLAQSDWTQVADAPVDATAWAAYRQALRDVPAQPGFPWEVTWPQQPE